MLMGDARPRHAPGGLNRQYNIVPVRCVEIAVLGVLANVDQSSFRFMRLRHTTMACKHIPNRIGDARRIGHLAIKILIVATP